MHAPVGEAAAVRDAQLSEVGEEAQSVRHAVVQAGGVPQGQAVQRGQRAQRAAPRAQEVDVGQAEGVQLSQAPQALQRGVPLPGRRERLLAC